MDGDAVKREGFSDGVAGGAGLGGDDGAVAGEKTIEERGLAGVGAANDGEGEALADDSAVGVGCGEVSEWGEDLLDAEGDLGLGEEIDVVFGEVYAGFKGGDELDEALLVGGDGARDRTA